MTAVILNEKRWKHDEPLWRRRLQPKPDAMGLEPVIDIPAGPWDDEPDKVQWIDGTTDLDCLIVRNPMGALCGYVGVPPGHPWHGVDYSACVADPNCGDFYCGHTPEAAISVHGGLTFASSCDESAKEGHGICHIPLPGRSDNVWWFGFDCAHAWDVCPGMLGLGLPSLDDVYRDLGFVQEQCAGLAEQLAAIA